jgi:glycosyltransferase involved in cell wall biosynthesis
VTNGKKELLLLVHTMNRGGASKVLTLIANHYIEKGWKVTFIVQHAINLYDMSPEIKLIELGNEKGDYSKLKFMAYVRKYVKENRPKTVLAFIDIINMLTIVATRGLKTKVIVSERNDISLAVAKWKYIASKILYKYADLIVFQSRKVQSYYSKKTIEKSLVIVNPIEIKCPSAEVREHRIVNSGRLTSQKNQKMLINAFARLYKEHPEYSLTIYGEGELRGDLENQVKELGVENVVSLPGNVLNIHEKIANAEIFALSSDFEGLSNALLESMMMGLTCVSTKCAGSTDVIRNQENGMLVDVGSEDQMYEALKWLVENPEKCAEYGRQAASDAQAFRKETILAKWDEILEA